MNKFVVGSEVEEESLVECSEDEAERVVMAEGVCVWGGKTFAVDRRDEGYRRSWNDIYRESRRMSDSLEWS